jgi:hypothetical protein
MKLTELADLAEKVEALHLTQHEREIAATIAELRKAQRLARQPGMDRVAVALNKKPDHSEVVAMMEVLRCAKALGFQMADGE